VSDARIQAEADGLDISGPLTFATVAALEARARALVGNLPARARVNLERVGRIDSAGVAFLVMLWRQAHRAGCRLVFEPVPEGLRPLLELYDLESIITDSTGAAGAETPTSPV
jgi:phospholipid transport system transporter-binding protein